MKTTLIERLIPRLGIESGGSFVDTLLMESKIVDALLGDSERAVTIVDVPHQGDRYIVFGNIGEGLTSQPLLVRAHLHKGADPELNWGCACKEIHPRLKKLGWLGKDDSLTTEEVARWFKNRAEGVGKDGEKYPVSYVPAAEESFARISIAGDLGERKALSPDRNFKSNRYEWFDLNEVPIGGSVYRISKKNTLWLFTRHGGDRWELTVVPKVSWATTDYHDGSRDFGTLLEGALIGYRVAKEEINR